MEKYKATNCTTMEGKVKKCVFDGEHNIQTPTKDRCFQR